MLNIGRNCDNWLINFLLLYWYSSYSFISWNSEIYNPKSYRYTTKKRKNTKITGDKAVSYTFFKYQKSWHHDNNITIIITWFSPRLAIHLWRLDFWDVLLPAQAQKRKLLDTARIDRRFLNLCSWLCSWMCNHPFQIPEYKENMCPRCNVLKH